VKTSANWETSKLLKKRTGWVDPAIDGKFNPKLRTCCAAATDQQEYPGLRVNGRYFVVEVSLGNQVSRVESAL
jgi:hypothetical protein